MPFWRTQEREDPSGLGGRAIVMTIAWIAAFALGYGLARTVFEPAIGTVGGYLLGASIAIVAIVVLRRLGLRVLTSSAAAVLIIVLAIGALHDDGSVFAHDPDDLGNHAHDTEIIDDSTDDAVLIATSFALAAPILGMVVPPAVAATTTAAGGIVAAGNIRNVGTNGHRRHADGDNDGRGGVRDRTGSHVRQHDVAHANNTPNLPSANPNQDPPRASASITAPNARRCGRTASGWRYCWD